MKSGNGQVQFQTSEGLPADQISEVQRFGFVCPNGRGWCTGLMIVGRAKRSDGTLIERTDKIHLWDWNGDIEVPTFTPSINCGGCGWHGVIEKGVSRVA